MKTRIIPFILVFLFVFQSCTQSEKAADEYKEVSAPPSVADESMPLAGFLEPDGESAKNGSYNGSIVSGTTIAVPLKLIKQGELGFESSDYQATRKTISVLTDKYKGYISKENEQTGNYRISNEIIIRVPSANVETLMNEIASGAKLVDYKRMNLTDVTEEYVDLETRLKTKREVEKRYVDILRKAQTIKDILAVEDQLRVIREEIESAEGRLKYLSNRVDLSTLTISVYQQMDYKYIPEHQPGFFERALKSLDNGWTGLLEGMLGLIAVWPLLLFILFVVIIVIRVRKRRRANKA